MQQPKSFVNRMLREPVPSWVHTRRRCEGLHPAPGVHPALRGAPGGEKCSSQGAPRCQAAFGCCGCKDNGHGSGWRWGREQGTSSGMAEEKGTLPRCCHAPAVMLQNSDPGWGQAASVELQNSLLGDSQELQIKSSPRAAESPGVACWPSRAEDGATAGPAHQLLLTLRLGQNSWKAKERLPWTSPGVQGRSQLCTKVWGDASWPGHRA